MELRRFGQLGIAALAASQLLNFGGCLVNGRTLRYVATTGLTYAGLEFVTDNDAIFDIFQDDFGSGSIFDDRFVPGAGRLEPGDAVEGTFNR
jgi:hypothetical protein